MSRFNSYPTVVSKNNATGIWVGWINTTKLLIIGDIITSNSNGNQISSGIAAVYF